MIVTLDVIVSIVMMISILIRSKLCDWFGCRVG